MKPSRLSGSVLATFALIGSFADAAAVTPDQSLAGRWRFALDRADAGINEEWFRRPLNGAIRLPGSLTEQGIGDDISTNTPWTGGIVDRSFFTEPEYEKYRQPGRVKVPFWLQPEKYYAGTAWFQRDVKVPPDWLGRRVVLFLERAHWETRVWVDNRLVGTNRSLSTPHEYDFGQLAPGKHTVTIRVDNRRIVDIGENSHGISDHTQGNWSGIVGKIELRSTPLVWIEDLQVYPQLRDGTYRVRGVIGNATGNSFTNQLRLDVLVGAESANSTGISLEVVCPLARNTFECVVPGSYRGVQLWDEFSEGPPLSFTSLTVVSDFAGPNRQLQRIITGVREVASRGTQFVINSNVTFLRGTLECAIFPKTGHPPMEIEEWRRIIGVAKSCGLNLLRFHSWCPPEAAFQAADGLGMYFQIETCWPNQSTSLGDGRPVDAWVYEETDRILKYYGNHPSFVLMAHGNEPGGKSANEFLAKYVAHYKARDPRRLWTSGAGWPQLPENQFHVTPDPRIQKWGGGLKSRINSQPPETVTDYRDYIGRRTVPVISHEIGQWCVYPNFNEIPKYTGYLKPENFEIFRDRLAANGLGALAKDFLLASGKLQALCYKEEIESALRTPAMGGFELLDLHDFPGQGTALVGVLDPFWEEKGYITAQEYSRFCNSTVPLARMTKRVFASDEKLTAEVEVAHFGAKSVDDAEVIWKLVSDAGNIAASGKLLKQSIPVGKVSLLGSITADLKNLTAPAHHKLVVSIAEGKFENDWDIWVYPAKPSAESGDVMITAAFDAAARDKLASGGKVLLTISGDRVRNFEKDPVTLGFSSIFWNTAWTKRQAPTTLGILCDPKHPALAEFPTEFHSNWQWWYLVHRAGALRLDLLPRDLKPIVRVIDDWVTARPLGLVVEGNVGKGKIIVCGFDLTDAALNDPVSRQMRSSLLAYMNSKKFKPTVKFNESQIGELIAPPRQSAMRKRRPIQASPLTDK